MNHIGILQLCIFVLIFLVAIMGLLLIKLKKSNDNSQAENEKLNALNKKKDQFFSIISHDLKDPVLSFRGLVDKINFLIKRNEPERIAELGKQVTVAVNQIEITLYNLLLWGKIKAGTITLRPESIVLQDLFKKSFKEYLKLAEDNGVGINIRVSTDSRIEVDKSSFIIIINNILSNAIKYSKAGSSIDILTKEDNEKIKLQIRDTGIGIPPEKLETIFDYDKRKRTPGTEGALGAGFGLALVKELVKLNKGQINIKSKLGQGTIVDLSFSSKR